MSWVEDYLARQKGQREADVASDPGYIGGFISSAVSGVGEMFGMEPFPTAEKFRAENPVSGLISEMAGILVPYVGWEGVLAKTPRLAASLEGAAARVGLDVAKQPIKAGAVNLAVRYSPVELSRLGTGLFLTEDWEKYGGLMADVGLSTMLAGGIGGLGGFLKSAGKRAPSLAGRIAEAPIGLAAPFELRIARSGNATPVGDVPLETIIQQRIRESLTERPAPISVQGKKSRPAAVHALEGNDAPKAVAGVNFLFNPSKNTKGLLRRKLMQDDGTWTLGEDGNAELLGGLASGFKKPPLKSMDDLAESGRFATVVDVTSDRAAGTMKRAVEALSPVGDGAFIGREAGDGLFIIARRIKTAPPAPVAAKGAKGAKAAPAPSPVAAGDQWFVIKTDKPDRFIPGAPKATKLTFGTFAKYREAFRPEVNQDTIFNQVQNRVIQTFTPREYDEIRRGVHPEKIRAEWTRRMAKGGLDKLGLQNSEMLNNLWDEAYKVIAPSMFKGVRNGLYDRLFHMLRLNKETAESLVNKLIGGEVAAGRRRGFGVRLEHQAEVAPGVKTLNKLLDENRTALTESDYQLIYSVGTAQAPKEVLAELTEAGMVSPAARAVLDGIEKLDKWYWGQMLPVAKALGLDAKFSLLQGPYIPRLMKGDNYVPVVDAASGQLKFIASGTRAQAQREAEVFVAEAKKLGLNYEAKPVTSWYSEGNDLLKLHRQMEAAALSDPQVKEVAKAAMRALAVENAGLRGGLLKGRMPKTLVEERTGVAASTGTEFTAKALINDLQQHYNMVGRYLGYQSWTQRWMPEAALLEKSAPKMAEDLAHRGRMMLGYEGKQAEYLNNVLKPILGPALGGKAASKIAQEANSLMYHWNIGIANPVFALVNLLTPLQTVAPWIAMMKVAPHAADDLMHTGFRFGSDGKVRGIWNTLDVPKLMMKALKEIGKPGDELLELLGRAKTDGSLSPQLFENFAGQGSKVSTGIRDSFNNAGGGVAGAWDAMKNMATWASRHSEEWSREYAFTAAYIVGRDLKGLTGEALYRFAQRGTHVTMYGYHAMDRSLMFTGPIGSMFGLFKNWQMHFIGSMFQYAGLGWREGIWAPMIWQFAGSLAVGGLGATPLVLAADQLTDWLDNQPNSYLWMKENWHDAADEIYYGFPALFGLSLQASSALPGTDVRNDLTMLSNFVFLERAKAAWKATGDAFEYADKAGQNPLKNPNIRDALLQGYAPRALWRLFSTTENDAIKSMSSGYPQVRDVSKLGQLAYTLGLNPTEIEEQQDTARYLWKDQQAKRAAIQNLGSRFAQAQLAHDVDEMQSVIRIAIAQQIPMSSVARSAQTRLRREQQQDLMSKFGTEGWMARNVIEED